MEEIECQIEILDQKIKAIPFLDDLDLRYRRHEQVPVPITKAAMFCILDGSGSMDKWKKEMAKRFLLLLYLFLQRSYETVSVVFIRHTQTAKEVDEQEFFYSQETGGTVVSSALKLMKEIIHERFPLNEWNIYGCQASDGDDWSDDLEVAYDMLANSIMPLVQYYSYIEVADEEKTGNILWNWKKEENSELWKAYE
ncbi:MAG: DUF444 family protein, partial [Bacteroidetes bacterium]|nr:DUF444 family protein [Bacteroidota bacterium]